MDKRSGKKDKSKTKKEKKQLKIDEAVPVEKLPVIQQKPTNSRQKK